MDDPVERVRRAYDSEAIAATYDARRFTSLRGRLGAARQRQLIRRCLARFGRVDRLLDLPCGTGRLLPVGASAADHVLGIDSARAMLAQAVRRGVAGRVSLCVGDAMRLPLRTGSVDVVVCVKFFHLLPAGAVETALAEFARVARRGAVVAVLVRYPVGRVAALRRRLLRRPPIRQPPPTLAEWTAWFARAGLRVDEVHRIWPGVSQEAVVLLRR